MVGDSRITSYVPSGSWTDSEEYKERRLDNCCFNCTLPSLVQFLGKYGFPPEVQKWIIGKRICKDEETLSKCEVNCSGHTLYLYLLRASAVNISREDYKRQWHPHAAPGREGEKLS